MDQKQKRSLSFLLLSLLFHSIWISLAILDFSQFNQENTANEDVIEIEYISQEEMQMQIVEQDKKSINEVEPEKAKYYSAKNQKVNEETKAVNSGKFNNKIQKGSQGSSKKQKQASKKPLPSLKDLNPDANWFAEKEKPKSQSANIETQLARSADYLKETKEGQQTILNTREFVYYTYYKRIRNQLQQYWEPSIKKKFSKLMNKGRYIASERDHLTKVLITLNDQGILTRVQVVEESGLRDLDDAAIEAFQQAAPFPNPPKGIVEQDGTVKIRWDFVVEA